MSIHTGNAVKHKVKLERGDMVRIMAGKDRHERSEGRILKIDRVRRRVMVEGLNIVKKTKKPQREGEQGEIIEVEAYLDISNVMIVCSVCGPTRIGYRVSSGKARSKERICRKCGKVL